MVLWHWDDRRRHLRLPRCRSCQVRGQWRRSAPRQPAQPAHTVGPLDAISRSNLPANLAGFGPPRWAAVQPDGNYL